MYGHHITEMVEALFRAGVVTDTPAAQQVLGDFWKDKIALVWTTDDVYCVVNKPISEEQAIEILEQVQDDHNAEYGVSWDSIRDAAQEVLVDDEEES